HFAKDRAGLGHGVDLKVAFQHFDLSLDQNVEDSVFPPFAEEHLTGAEGRFRELLAEAENLAHHPTSKNTTVSRIADGSTERMPGGAYQNSGSARATSSSCFDRLSTNGFFSPIPTSGSVRPERVEACPEPVEGGERQNYQKIDMHPMPDEWPAVLQPPRLF